MKVVKLVYRQILIPGVIWGTLGGLLIILLFYLKSTMGIPSIVLFVINCAITIFFMIAALLYYRKKARIIGFTIAREFAFLIYLVVAIIILTFRFIDGYFYEFSAPAILLSMLFIIGIGRALSYVIAMNIYNEKS